ncbi:MAG: hypothetical protein AAGF56_07040 [Pseudomonadota bacterium]
MKYSYLLLIPLFVFGCTTAEAPPAEEEEDLMFGVDSATLNLSCDELRRRNANLQAGLRQNQQTDTQALTGGMVDGLLQAGSTALFRNAAQSSSAEGFLGAQVAASSVENFQRNRQQQRSEQQMEGMTSMATLMSRSAQVQAAMTEKGC